MKKIGIILFCICIASFLFSFVKQQSVPACLNADEAAFGYNAYSILKTGKDEYGTFLPLRLKSFGDYKMPLYSYVSVPFVQLFGLSIFGARAANIFLALLLPLVVYFLAWEIFENKRIAIISSLLAGISLSTHITARHAHESFVSMLAVATMFLFYFRARKTNNVVDIVLFLTFTALSLISYQSARLFVFFIGLVLFVRLFRCPKPERKNIIRLGLLFIGVVIVMSSVDLIYNPSRISNLLFFNNPGFKDRVFELRAEGGSILLYNKLFVGIKELAYQHLAYFSPQFLLSRGDENYRFGYPGMSLITLTEYTFFFIGIYYLFKEKDHQRYFLVGLLLISPLSGSLSWAGISLTRVLFLFIVIFLIASYGFVAFTKSLPRTYRSYIVGIIIFFELIGLILSWDFYFNHYFKRAVVIRDWQCGYAELGEYIKHNYNNFNHFYITKKNGQPYIFTLFFLKYAPEKYQRVAKLSKADQYGFGQVDSYDKFIFDLPNQFKETKAAYIGFPDDFINRSGFNPTKDFKYLKKIKIGTEEIFYIYEKS